MHQQDTDEEDGKRKKKRKIETITVTPKRRKTRSSESETPQKASQREQEEEVDVDAGGEMTEQIAEAFKASVKVRNATLVSVPDAVDAVEGRNLCDVLWKQTAEKQQKGFVDVDKLNCEQREFFDFVLEHFNGGDPKSQLLHTLHAGAGCGKSHCIRALRQVIQTRMVVTAMTGTAALLVDGLTLHSFLGLPVNGKWPLMGKPKKDNLMATLRTIVYIVIDEFSMLSSSLFCILDQRLKELLSSELVFGGKSIILVGDTAQLPPIGGNPVIDFVTRWPDSGQQLYLNAFSTGHVLVRNMRLAEEDSRAVMFRGIVTKLRTQETLDAQEIALLKSRWVTKLPAAVKLNGTHLYFDNHNRLLHSQFVNQVFQKCGTKSVSLVGVRSRPGGESVFHDVLDLFVGQRVMLLRNLNIPMGLTNGAIGTVMAVNITNPPVVYVKFDCCFLPTYWPERLAGCVPLSHVNDDFNDPAFEQLPLTTAEAITSTKSQGQSYPKLVLHDVSTWSDVHIYVGISRATSIDGLYFVGDCERAFTNSSNSDNKVILTEERIRQLGNGMGERKPRKPNSS